MKRIGSVLMYIISVILLGCSEKDSFLIENTELEIPTLKLKELSDASIFYVNVKGRNQITGFTDDFAFQTNNTFNSYQKVIGGMNSGWELLTEFPRPEYSEGRQTLFLKWDDSDHQGWEILSRLYHYHPASGNFVVYYDLYLLKDEDNKFIYPYNYYGTISNPRAFFHSQNNGWIIARYTRNSNGPDQNLFPHGIRVYRIDGSQSLVNNHISIIEGYQYVPADLFFLNDSEGYILANKSTDESGYLFKTTDGGHTWVIIGTFPKKTKKIHIIDSNHITISHEGGFFATQDGGSVWSETTLGENMITSHMAKDGTLFASVVIGSDQVETICKLYLSQDKGLTWNPVNGKSFYGRKINFIDKDLGVAYSSSLLQLTRDGGKTWELLAFRLKDDNDG